MQASILGRPTAMAKAKQPTSTNDDSLQQISRVPRRKIADQHRGIKHHDVDASELLEHHERREIASWGRYWGSNKFLMGWGASLLMRAASIMSASSLLTSLVPLVFESTCMGHKKLMAES